MLKEVFQRKAKWHRSETQICIKKERINAREEYIKIKTKKKWAKDLNRNITRENIQMVKETFKKCLTSVCVCVRARVHVCVWVWVCVNRSVTDLPDPGIKPHLPHCRQILNHLSH